MQAQVKKPMIKMPFEPCCPNETPPLVSRLACRPRRRAQVASVGRMLYQEPDAGPITFEAAVREDAFAKERLGSNKKGCASSRSSIHYSATVNQSAARIGLNLQLDLPRGAFTGAPRCWRTSAAWRGAMAKVPQQTFLILSSCVLAIRRKYRAGWTSPDWPP